MGVKISSNTSCKNLVIGNRITPIIVPGIITDGLVLHLDAGNNISYPGSGVNWYDLSGNNINCNLVNGPLYTPANLGSILFDGINDFGRIPYNILIDPVIGITFEMWCYPTNIRTERYYELYRKEVSSGRQLFSFQEYGTVISFGTDTTGNGYHELDVSINYNNYTNKWVHVLATYSNRYKAIYQNGQLIGSTTTVSGTLKRNNFTAYIGTLGLPDYGGGLREYFKGNIASFNIYNRGLSATEVLQNYNALKSRYSL